MGSGRSCLTGQEGLAEVTCKSRSSGNRESVVGGCSSLETDFNELLHKLGRIISNTAFVSLIQSP